MNFKGEKGGLEYELSGKALKIYLYFLKVGKPVSISEIQRELGFKNPSHVSYYLDRLIEMGLIEKGERGSYHLTKSVKIGVLKQFVKIGRVMLPRYLFYASFLTSMLITYVLKFYDSMDPFALTFGVISALILWFEAIKLWLEKPI